MLEQKLCNACSMIRWSEDLLLIRCSSVKHVRAMMSVPYSLFYLNPCLFTCRCYKILSVSTVAKKRSHTQICLVASVLFEILYLTEPCFREVLSLCQTRSKRSHPSAKAFLRSFYACLRQIEGHCINVTICFKETYPCQATASKWCHVSRICPNPACPLSDCSSSRVAR